MFFIEVVTCAWTHQIYLLPLHIPFLSPPATSIKRPIRVNLKLPPHNWNFIVKSVYTRRHFEGVDLFEKEHLAWVKIDVLIDCFLFYIYSTSFCFSSAPSRTILKASAPPLLRHKLDGKNNRKEMNQFFTSFLMSSFSDKEQGEMMKCWGSFLFLTSCSTDGKIIWLDGAWRPILLSYSSNTMHRFFGHSF